ncbi:zonular occludens toxin domain-containing protein [Lacrimispora indolis]|uniref:zonular occludens toxin domain-containing protein n=1 Tax=Lacrimispora indolis TaxID=69825 RepID=UPI000413F35B|nr:zonular occludens toxin domain-containing protein [[Clostridium] methoxybenzovorans]
MKILFWFFCAYVLYICYYAYKFRNPYKLIMIFGKKGSGKTTFLTKLTLMYLKKNRPVYSTTEVPGAILFNPKDLGFIHIPENAVILIDEVGLVWNNRDFKSFKKEYREYFKMQRQYKHTVYLFSQAFDIDKSLRELTDAMYLMRSYFGVYSVARRINRKITIVSASSAGGAGESRIVDDLAFDSLLLFWAGSIKLTWIPKYAQYFKSFNPPPLPDSGEFRYCPIPPLPYTNRKEHVLYVLSGIRTIPVRLHKLFVLYIQAVISRIADGKTSRRR